MCVVFDYAAGVLAHEWEGEMTSSHIDLLTSESALSFGSPQGAGGLLYAYLTPEQLARELNITKRTLDRWHASRIGPPRVTIGRRPLYRREAVTDWIRKREQSFGEHAASSPGRRTTRRARAG